MKATVCKSVCTIFSKVARFAYVVWRFGIVDELLLVLDEVALEVVEEEMCAELVLLVELL